MKKRFVYNCVCGNHGDDIFDGAYNQKCSKCNRHQRNYTIKYSLNKNTEWKNKGGVDVLMKDSPRWSDSLGVNPLQIPQFKKQFGDLMEFDKDGRCLVKNRHHKKQLMKARGYVETE